jgi:hypothetical protein
MWLGELALSELERTGRWTVEPLAAHEGPLAVAAYPRVRLAELVTERRETVQPGRWPDFCFAYLGLEHVAPQTGFLEGFTPRRGREVRSASRVFRPGDVLYGRLRPYLNKVHLAAEPVACGICSGEFLVLIPDPERVRPLVLRELLASAYVAEAVKGKALGSALPRLQLADLLAQRVPLPPLEVQVELEAELRQARAALARTVALARSGGAQLRAAFEAAMRDGGTLPPPRETALEEAPIAGLPPELSTERARPARRR